MEPTKNVYKKHENALKYCENKQNNKTLKKSFLLSISASDFMSTREQVLMVIQLRALNGRPKTSTTLQHLQLLCCFKSVIINAFLSC